MRQLRRHVDMGGRHVPTANRSRGFTLIELVMTLTVLTILTIGVIPLIKVSVKRQREQQLRETLREMRIAIEQFHREALAAQCLGTTGAPPAPPVGGGGGGLGGGGGAIPTDPRLRVRLAPGECQNFGVDNPDRYPPDLETLVKGVNVEPIAGAVAPLLGSGPSGPSATDNRLTSTKKKVYLRKIPLDPMTGEADWELRSTYDAADATSWGGENVFDVRSKSKGTALNGEKYSDW